MLIGRAPIYELQLFGSFGQVFLVDRLRQMCAIPPKYTAHLPHRTMFVLNIKGIL